MAQAGFTPISLYFSSTAAAVPIAGNLANGELALNIADMKLYAKNSAGAVTLLASSGGATGTVSSVAATVPPFLSIAGSPITTSGTLAISLSGSALPTTSGGTGLTSFTANGVVYASSSSVLATSSNLVYDGVNLTQTGTSGTLAFNQTQSVSGAIVNTKTATTSNSLGAYDQFATKDNTGTTNTWAVGVNIATANSSWELYNGGTRFSVTQAGNVGIGTVPISGYLLTVNGQGAFTGPTSDVDGNGGVRINYGNSSGTVERFLTLNANGTTNAAIGLNMVDSTAGSMTFSTRFGNVLGERFRMGSLGQFGIAGANYGLAGQVLTSGGASAAPTWAAAGGGGTTNGKLYFYSSFN